MQYILWLPTFLVTEERSQRIQVYKMQLKRLDWSNFANEHEHI